nr:MAG TPA: hypothetical protein [Caudoviricetes sp.]
MRGRRQGSRRHLGNSRVLSARGHDDIEIFTNEGSGFHWFRAFLPKNRV